MADTFKYIISVKHPVALRLVYDMLPVSLDCPFLISPLVFSNVYLNRFIKLVDPLCKFKNIYKFEKCLQSVGNHNDRNSMIRLRTSSHRLQIAICRYTLPKTPIHDRLCKNCSDNLVEDKVHLLLDCSKFNDLGRDFVTGCFNKNINIFYISFLLRTKP